MKAQLIKQFHTVCSKNGLDRVAKLEIYASYGVESSNELTIDELREAIKSITGKPVAKKQKTSPDQWRKRVIAAIGGWLRASNIDHDIDRIKAIACRASGYSKFNAIPVSRLRTVYSEFANKGETVKQTSAVKHEIINTLQIWN